MVFYSFVLMGSFGVFWFFVLFWFVFLIYFLSSFSRFCFLGFVSLVFSFPWFYHSLAGSFVGFHPTPLLLLGEVSTTLTTTRGNLSII